MVLVDTNIAVSLFVPDRRSQARQRLRRFAPYDLHLAPQTIYELYSVLTRSGGSNGYAFSPTEAATAVEKLLRIAQTRPDPPGLRERWLDLVVRHGVTGKASHDARLAAYALELGLAAILTDDAGFARYGLPLV